MTEDRKGLNLSALQGFQPRQRPQERAEEAEPAAEAPKPLPRKIGRQEAALRAKAWPSREPKPAEVQINIRYDERVIDRFKLLRFMERLSYGETLELLLDTFEAVHGKPGTDGRD